MSSLIVEVCRIDAINRHPQADLIEIAVIKGWNCVVKKGEFQPGDKCVYFPPDTLLPLEFAERIGVTRYLKQLRRDYPAPEGMTYGGRVYAARLRGVASYGLLIPCRDGWEVGQDVAEHYRVAKWQPPEAFSDGQQEKPHPLFHTYTDIENYKNFPHLFQAGEEIVITEKLHGTNSRVGYIHTEVDGFVFMAGSHGVRKKAPPPEERPGLYWLPLRHEAVKALLVQEATGHKAAILFGEIFGDGVQDLRYGLTYNARDFRAFDLSVDGQYVDAGRFGELCQAFGVPAVPVLYRGPYSPEAIRAHTGGCTLVGDQQQIREGIVIRPVKERWCAELDGRLILKNISDDYVLRKGGTEYH